MMSIEELLAAWDEHGARIRGTLRSKGVSRDDLPDVEQESRIKLVCAVRGGELPDATKLLAWFVAIAWHVWIDSVRKRHPQTVDKESWKVLAACAADHRTVDPADEVADRESSEILRAAIGKLDGPLWEVVERYLEHGNLRKVAAELGIPYTTAVGRYRRALRLLVEKQDGRLL
jgi:DNA-directed RNA polymerase specialized sigma24 family protein